MKIAESYLNYVIETTEKLVNVPSPTGYTHRAQEFVAHELESFGFKPERTNRGNVLCHIGGEVGDDGLILTAHFDTIGAMVRSIKPNGRLRLARVGGGAFGSWEAENCIVFTRSGAEIEGTLQMNEPSIHVAGGELNEKKRTLDEMEVVLDIVTDCADTTRRAGVENGDPVAFEPRFRRAGDGYIKSRYLDDKACCAVLLAIAKFVSEEKPALGRAVWLDFTAHEEIGTGGGSGLPDGCTEIVALDMGCVGEDLVGNERKVSLCAMDASGPYDYDMISRMKAICERDGLPCAIDFYAHYGSDADIAIKAGYHLRHACIGPGVYASHGYERTHIDGLRATLALTASLTLGE